MADGIQGPGINYSFSGANVVLDDLFAVGQENLYENTSFPKSPAKVGGTGEEYACSQDNYEYLNRNDVKVLAETMTSKDHISLSYKGLEEQSGSGMSPAQLVRNNIWSEQSKRYYDQTVSQLGKVCGSRAVDDFNVALIQTRVRDYRPTLSYDEGCNAQAVDKYFSDRAYPSETTAQAAMKQLASDPATGKIAPRAFYELGKDFGSPGGLVQPTKRGLDSAWELTHEDDKTLHESLSSSIDDYTYDENYNPLGVTDSYRIWSDGGRAAAVVCGDNAQRDFEQGIFDAFQEGLQNNDYPSRGSVDADNRAEYAAKQREMESKREEEARAAMSCTTAGDIGAGDHQLAHALTELVVDTYQAMKLLASYLP